MSAGNAASAPAPDGDVEKLAPKFRSAVDRAIVLCTQDRLNAVVYEALRSEELQSLYYQRGRTIIPPAEIVTNARSQLYSWHGFGLAVDVIHATKRWGASEQWFEQVAAHFRTVGCRWGGEWRQRDLPHFQWGLCKPSPSDRARELLATGGLAAVWRAVDAL